MADPSVKNDLQSQQEVLSSPGTGNADGPVARLRKRWRKRRKDSIAIVPTKTNRNGIDYETTHIIIADNAQQNEQSTTAKSCPMKFAMTFPRYRIDLTPPPNASRTSAKKYRINESEQRRMRRVERGTITKLLNSSDEDEKDKKAKNDNPLLVGIISGIFQGWKNPRKSVESLYSNEIEREHFRWISSPSDEEGAVNEELVDEEFIAAGAFWRLASDICIIQQQQNNNNVPQEEEQSQYYLALPDSTVSVAQNLCDILNWYSNYSSENKRQGDTIIRADIDSRQGCEDDAIPIVRYTITNTKKGQQQQDQQQHQLPQPTAHDTERHTKAWVKRVLIQLGICPFTRSQVKSGQGLRDLGVPVANIMYRHSDAAASSRSDGNGNASVGSCGDIYLLMADAWEAISDMVAAGPTGISSILLSAPGFDDDFELWAGPIFAMLETCVGAIQAEEMVGIVCFHPQYVTPDGKSWPGFGHMHSVPRLKKWYEQHSPPAPTVITPTSSPAEAAAALSAISQPDLTDDDIAAGGAWQRRTPHAVINVLRAEQLEAAESRRSTGVLYERNIRVLVGNDRVDVEAGSSRTIGVGLEKLAEDLKQEQSL